MWSRMGVRACYGMALYEAAKADPDVLAMSADLGRSSGLNQLMSQLPEQFVNAGIAEQNMVGVASGLAREGYKVYASSFAPFVSMRASEQVRMNLGYMGLPVRLVALGSGLAMGFLGNSHYGLEDVAVMRAIPGMTVVSPADCAEVFKVIQASLEFEGPLYVRLTGSINNPPVYNQEYEFALGKAITLREGTDLCIVATGSMVATAAKVAEYLETHNGLTTKVVNMHTIKPLDEDTLNRLFTNFDGVCTLEEHSLIGGLGSAVAELMAKSHTRVRLLMLGINDCYVKTGDYHYALQQAGLSVDQVAEKILAWAEEMCA